MMMGGGGGMHAMFMGSSGRERKRPSIAMYRRLFRFVTPYRRKLVLAAALLVLSTALGLVWPQVVLRVLDAGLKDGALLDELVVALLGVLLFRAVIDGVRQYVMAWTGERVIFDLRMEIVRHLQSLSLSFFTRRRTGELMSHVTSDATLVHGVVTQTIISVLGQVLTLVGGLVVIFVMNWRLALLTLVLACTVRTSACSRRRSPRSARCRRSRARSTSPSASARSSCSRCRRSSSARGYRRPSSRSSGSSGSRPRSSSSGTEAIR